MMRHKLLGLLLSGAMALTAQPLSPAPVDAAYAQTVTFDSFPPAVNDGEPIRGVDISSVLAIEEAGVVFRDDDGNPADLFEVLADHGVNYIRVRVWNDPTDGSGHSYGGGNNDVAAAAEIGRRAAQYGMKLLVDFHYSDFWSDPEKQRTPKAWEGYTYAEKGSAIYYYTLESLNTIRDAGADIGMVQVGNETNSVFCGETDMYTICEMFTAGCNAVRDFDSSVLRVLHFANPSNADHYYWYAKVLNECSVDYDVFATSYYPYWHGTLSNLTAVLKTIGDTYDKYVMVAETAYPYTSDDGDSFGNVVSSYSTDCEFRYDISVDGQAQCLTEVFQAVAGTGSRGIGVFYWEPAWLGVENLSWSEQSKRWEQYGSGWATSYASAYDSSATQAGGSSYDNQALFDFSGKPLDSLNVFSRIYPQGYRYSQSDDASLVSGTYTIQNVGSGLYLTTDGSGNVIQSPSAANWHIEVLADGTCLLTDESGQLLTVDTTGNEKSPVQLGGRSGGKEQGFKIIERDGSYALLTEESGRTRSVDIFDSSSYEGAWAAYSKTTLSDSQRFVLTLIEEDATEPTTTETAPTTETRPEHELTRGDIRRDGEIDLLDAVALQRYLTNSLTITQEEWEAADLNEDGRVNIFDLALLKNLCLRGRHNP